ncbi:hypothetical protein [Wenzhouxiangella limi]|uniref:Uncharacterized protein n=1 Tax=Wenzhouxiangella limi TaxID=2707351 RepID=A0A845UX45_9GAMM|nr:hypothetical protein [Wenzhouxiangella limi]NDY95074.1 hypothetical protein [Wenzhouxiangella limi]
MRSIATALGMALMMAAVVVILGISDSEAWHAILEQVMGPRGWLQD